MQREYVNADLGRMARSLMDQADGIPDDDPLANYRKSSLRDAASSLLRAYAELTDLDQWEQEADQERGRQLMGEWTLASAEAAEAAGPDFDPLAHPLPTAKWECHDCGVKGFLPMPGQCPNPTCRSVALVTP